jgi:hypothetical protein
MFDVARLAYLAVGSNRNASFLGETLHGRHFLGKHGRTLTTGKPARKNEGRPCSFVAFPV